MTKEPLRCTDACGRTVADMSEAEAKAWRFLEISKRWRCPACTRELDAANHRMAESGRDEG
jgi:rubredoxin